MCKGEAHVAKKPPKASSPVIVELSAISTRTLYVRKIGRASTMLLQQTTNCAAWALTSWGTLGKLLNLFELQFLHL